MSQVSPKGHVPLEVVSTEGGSCGSSNGNGHNGHNGANGVNGVNGARIPAPTVPRSDLSHRSVVLVNPKATYADEIAQKCFPPINLLLLAACLEKADIPVHVVDANAMRMSDEELGRRLSDANPILIGVPMYAETIYTTARTIEFMRSSFPSAKIVTGGPQASAAPTWMLDEVPEIDYVLAGDGEESLVDLARYLRAGQDPTDKIGGLYTRDSKLTINGRGPRVQNLDDIPLPSRHLVQEVYDLKRYYALLIAQRPVDSMITSRGCPHSCHFCYNVDTKMRFRSIDNCLEEIHWLRDRGITNIEILDDNFTAARSRAIKFFERLKKEKLGITLRVKARADAIREDMVKAAREAGVYNMSIGMESGSDGILTAMNKRITVEELTSAAEMVMRYGMACHTGWIIGYPGETPETIEQTVDLIRKMKPTTAGVGILRPYPGTALYDQAKAEGTLMGEWSAHEPKAPWVKLPWVDSYQDLVKILKKVMRRIYWRPYYAWLYGKRIVTNANWIMAQYALQEISRSMPFSKKKTMYESHAVDINH
jgi:anaerobic magnesium-protoporphyrin IX monomethyl ester cyclase